MSAGQAHIEVNSDHVRVPCGCTKCAQQFQNLRDLDVTPKYVSSISRQEGQLHLVQRMNTAEKNRQALVPMIVSAGDTFFGRWKKTRKKRVAYLVEAFPDRNLVSSDPRRSNPTQNILLVWLKWDNVVDDASLLPKLLQARTQHTGQEWFAWDLAMAQPGWDACQYRLQWCGATDRLEYVSMVAHGPAFGQLVPWTAAEAHRMDSIGFPRAEIVVSSQELLLSMLRTLVKVVLQTPAGTTASNLHWQELASRQFRGADDLESKSTLGTEAFETPPGFVPQSVLDAFRGRLQEAGDTVWLLQTDPWQLSATIEAVRKSDMSKLVGADNFYRHAVYSISVVPIRRMQEWKFMVQESENLVHTYQHFQADIKPGQEAPQEYQDALACWQVMLSHMLAVRSQDLEDLLPRLKAFEHHFLVEEDIVDGMGVIGSERRDSNIAEISTKDPLFACVTMLALPTMSNNMVYTDAAFDGLEAIIREEGVASKHSRIEKQLLDNTTDLGTVWKAFQGSKMARPAFEECRVGEACELGKSRPFWTIRGRDIGKKQKLLPPPVKLGELLEKFDKRLLPSGPRNQKWLEKFDLVHRHCQDFWDEVRLQEEDALKATGCTKADIRSCMSWISYDEDLDHLNKLDEGRQGMIDPKSKPLKDLATQLRPKACTPLKEQGESHIVLILPKRKKAKEKTRPSPDTAAARPPVQEAPSPSTSDDISQVVLRKEASLTLLRSLMRDEDGTGPKATHWNNVVAALDDAGFKATTTGESEVAFRNIHMHQSIVFHKLHPDPKCSKRLLEGMGKRLSKRFGWTAGSFVREDEGTAAGDGV